MDLVCIDPPFAKNDTFTADKLKPPLTKDEAANEMRLLRGWGIATQEQADAAGLAWPDDPKARGGYRDTWAWDADIHEDWVDGIKATHPAVNLLIEATREIHGDGIAAYLAFMAIRLFEIHRILKPTGSLYLHCDHTASGYLRQLLDGVFGKDNFRNEIVWGYEKPRSASKIFRQNHDTIYFYSKSDKWTFTPLRVPLMDGSFEYRKPFKRPDGTVWKPKEKGKQAADWWYDIPSFATRMSAVERTGYPTQKPIALAERIIQASTNPGDIVLDCFAGCAYTAVAAEKLGRKWAACDINPRAWTVFKRQFNKGGDLPKLTCNDATTGQQVMGSEPTVTIHGPQELPARTSPITYEVKPLRTPGQRARRYKREETLMSRVEMLTALLQFSGGKAWCCGYESRNADGTLALGNYELDHIIPKSQDGSDDIVNRAPLCPAHNRLKRDLNITLTDLRFEVMQRRELQLPNYKQLARLDEALNYAYAERQRAYERKHGKPLGI